MSFLLGSHCSAGFPFCLLGLSYVVTSAAPSQLEVGAFSIPMFFFAIFAMLICAAKFEDVYSVYEIRCGSESSWKH